jgi:hypothetical protein
MFITPSTLTTHYRLDGGLEGRIQQVVANRERFLRLTRQTEPITWHADFVLPKFAQQRQILPSFNLATYFEIFSKNFPYPAVFQIHLMGEDEDMEQSLEFLQTQLVNPQWQYQILVRPRDYIYWTDQLKSVSQYQLGVWYDLGDWEAIGQFDHSLVLLMTVKAGLSGQSLTESIINLALTKVAQNPNTQFILDGGWKIETNLTNYPNLCIASDTSFWKLFM